MDEKPRKVWSILAAAWDIFGPVSIAELHRRRQTANGLRWLDAAMRLLVFRWCIHLGCVDLLLGGIILPFGVLLVWLPDFHSRPVEAVLSVALGGVFGALIGTIAVLLWRELLKSFD